MTNQCHMKCYYLALLTAFNKQTFSLTRLGIYFKSLLIQVCGCLYQDGAAFTGLLLVKGLMDKFILV